MIFNWSSFKYKIITEKLVGPFEKFVDFNHLERWKVIGAGNKTDCS